MPGRSCGVGALTDAVNANPAIPASSCTKRMQIQLERSCRLVARNGVGHRTLADGERRASKTSPSR